MTFEKENKILEFFAGLSDEYLVEIHNAYDLEATMGEDRIYHMEELNEVLDGYTPTQVANAIFFGSFRPVHKWFKFDGYGNLKSFNYPIDEIFISDILDYIDETGDDLGFNEIKKILQEGM